MTDLEAFRKLVPLDHGLVVVSTSRSNGMIQSSVVNAGVIDHPLHGRPVVSFVAAESSRRLVNLRARPRAAVVIRAGWQWAGVEGPVELAGPDDPLKGHRRRTPASPPPGDLHRRGRHARRFRRVRPGHGRGAPGRRARRARARLRAQLKAMPNPRCSRGTTLFPWIRCITAPRLKV